MKQFWTSLSFCRFKIAQIAVQSPLHSKEFFAIALQGWTIESLQNWGQFTMLAVPGMLMLCTEWWGFEVGTFLMGE